MKKFIKKFILVLGVLMLLLIIGLIFGAFWGLSYLNNKQNIKNESILEIRFVEDIPEKSISVSKAESIALGTSAVVSVKEFLELLNYASDDDKIKAISIIGTSNLRHAKSLELARSIRKFKESGKPVFAYGDYYSQGAYALASESDSIFLNPSGYLDLKGYAMIMPYLKDFLAKYHIDMEVFVAGKYKSYVEMYNRNESSDQNRMQYDRYLQFLVSQLVDQISTNRNLPSEEVGNIIYNGLAYNAYNSLSMKLVDELKYKSDYYRFLEDRVGVEEKNVLSLSRYKQYITFKEKQKKANVAYVVLDGSITKDQGNASAVSLRKSFKEIRENEEIKTILLRINSPGGSAFASEEIWHEIELCKAQGIEVISSVSAISASGGYYTMCNSDKIFCSPASVTGSIGVFIAFPVYHNALKENFDIHFDQIETGPLARRNTGLTELSDEQKGMYKKSTEELYDRFLDRVKDGRKLDRSLVDSIAQGRIYAGVDALEINLVDSLIYLDEVYEYIKLRNDFEEIILKEYPEIEKELFPPVESLFSAKMNAPEKLSNMLAKNSENLKLFLMSGEPIARMPLYELNY